MKKLIITLLLSVSSITCFAETQTSIITDNGQTVYLQCYGDGIVRIVKTTDKNTPLPQSVAAIANMADVMKVTSSPNAITAKTPLLIIKINKVDGRVSFASSSGKKLTEEPTPATFTDFIDADNKTYQPRQSFSLTKDEAIYGFGILQNGKMNQRGIYCDLRPGNLEDGIPFFQSDRGYGIFWDNISATHVDNSTQNIELGSESANAVDYYFFYGPDADGVIKNVRLLTGKVPMAPMWTYGFHQCRERYKSQDELLEVLHHYRRDSIPVDGMIQDWQYWGSNYLWNAMDFLAESFDKPQEMIDEVHNQNAHLMISVWQSFGPKTLQYAELDEKGLLFDMGTWPQSGISHVWPPMMEYPSGVRVLDVYSPEARDIYWKYLSKLYDMGLDGWWMDSTEPDHHDVKDEDFDHQTYMGTYRSVLSAFPLLAVEGVYSHQLNYGNARDQRPFILTRSCYFGQQRTGSNVWSGDVGSSWEMLRKQIPNALNFSLTGNPNFNSDLGGFFAGSYNWSWQDKPAYENPAYRELYVRWMQFGVFNPMMRSHGTDTPRELYYYGKPGEPVYDAMLSAIKLRYSLLPYIYSTAWQVSKNDDTFMRALVMDYPDDDIAKNSTSEFMFGRNILATPVINSQYTPEIQRKDDDANAGWDKENGIASFDNLSNAAFDESRIQNVYLPKGKWYYFYDGNAYEGGKNISFSSPLHEAPFFVKAGSILPIGPDVQYAAEKPWDNLEIRIYPGKNGHFTLYEDAGDGFGYMQGQYTEIPFSWNDKTNTLIIGERIGEYDGMIPNRKFNINVIGGTCQSVDYNGKEITLKL